MNKNKLYKFQEFKDLRGKITVFKEINNFNLKQINYSESKKNVIRGMHYQRKKLINKIIYVTYGKILDVLVNVKTGKIYYYQLDKRNPMLFIPKDFAHGFQVLSDKVKMIYLFDGFYEKKMAIGFNTFDNELNIKWKKNQKTIISQKDKSLKSFQFFLEKI